MRRLQTLVAGLLLTLGRVPGEQIHWGETFGGLDSINVEYDCQFNGKPICCGLLSGYNSKSKETTSPIPTEKNEHLPHRTRCSVYRLYEPSKYELKHFQLAQELAALPTSDQRRERHIDLMIEDIPHANKWLERVHQYMKSGKPLEKSDVDEQYLSKFHVNETCRVQKSDGTYTTSTTSLVEYIEPLVLAARHPFAHTGCKRHEPPIARLQTHMGEMAFKTQAQGVDYVLLQSGEHTRTEARRAHGRSARNFLLDAGTSSFESSLKWFYCAYLQRGVKFDEAYGWEYTLLEPQKFWQGVPDEIAPHYHFYNAPITAGNTSMSPLRFIAEIAQAQDFVAFKLDVDTPLIELPLALELQRDPRLHALVDEFFFELHFRCDLMMSCAWGYEIPTEFDGLKLDLPNTLKYFSDLRHKGVRAHIWP